MDIFIFGQLVDIIGHQKITVEQIHSTHSLKKYLVEKYPALQNKTFRIAVNHDMIEEDKDISPQDQLALLPPFSGG